MRLKYLLVFIILANNTIGQNKPLPHLSADLINKEGVLFLKFKENWKYSEGDKAEWAKPEFDDSRWPNIAPNSLAADAMPDSLWNGYGWWRLSFTADQGIYNQITRIFFESWGAAEIYLDGEKVQQYGQFSIQANSEKNHVTNYAADRIIKIRPNKKHLIAIRFSNHQA